MRRTLLSALTAVATLVALLVPATPASASIWNHVWMESVASGLCADVTWFPPSERVCADVGEQLWTFDGASTTSVHRIVNTGTGECLTAVGSTVQGQTCGGLASQRWRLTGSGNTFTVMSTLAGTCLNRNGLAAPLTLGGCTSGQRWKLLF